MGFLFMIFQRTGFSDRNLTNLLEGFKT